MNQAELIEALRSALLAYDTAATKFIEKVDRGEARSVETYRELRRARILGREACQQVAED